jgi:hypothetical protein
LRVLSGLDQFLKRSSNLLIDLIAMVYQVSRASDVVPSQPALSPIIYWFCRTEALAEHAGLKRWLLCVAPDRIFGNIVTKLKVCPVVAQVICACWRHLERQAFFWSGLVQEIPGFSVPALCKFSIAVSSVKLEMKVKSCHEQKMIVGKIIGSPNLEDTNSVFTLNHSRLSLLNV